VGTTKRTRRHGQWVSPAPADTAEIRLDRGFHAILGRQIIERDGVQTEIHLEEGEHVDGRVIFFQKLKLRPQLVNIPPNVVHGSVGLLAGLDHLLEAGDQFAVGGNQRLLGFDLRDDGPLRGEGWERDDCFIQASNWKLWLRGA
jgi:hypothetical protein